MIFQPVGHPQRNRGNDFLALVILLALCVLGITALGCADVQSAAKACALDSVRYEANAIQTQVAISLSCEATDNPKACLADDVKQIVEQASAPALLCAEARIHDAVVKAAQ